MAIIMPVPDRLTRLTLAAQLPGFLRPGDPLISALANAPGQRVFTLTLPAIASDRRIADAATPAGWRFLAGAGAQTASAEVSEPIDGNPPKLRSVSRGPQIAHALQATRQSEALDRASETDFELRVLRVPGLLIEAIWLKQQGGDDDLIIPYLTPLPQADASRVLPVREFLEILRTSPAARKDADDKPGYRGARI